MLNIVTLLTWIVSISGDSRGGVKVQFSQAFATIFDNAAQNLTSGPQTPILWQGPLHSHYNSVSVLVVTLEDPLSYKCKCNREQTKRLHVQTCTV